MTPGARKWALAALGLALLAAVFPLGYGAAKTWRARMLAAKCEAAMAQGDARAAQATLFTAQRLAPQDPAVIRAGARYFTLQADPRAAVLWDALVRRPGAGAEDWEACFHAALQLKDRLLAFEALKGFDRAAPEETIRSRQMRCQLLAALGNVEAARRLARELVAEGVDGGNWGFFAHGLLLGGSEADRSAARAWLMKALGDDALRGLAAGTVLARDAGLDEGESMRLEARLRTHPEAGLAHQILAASLESRRARRTGGPAAERAVWQAFAAPRPLDERITILRWLVGSGGGVLGEGLVTEAEALSRKDAVLVYIDWLGSRGRWDEVRRVLLEPRAPLPARLRHTYLARAHAELGEPGPEAKHWQLAVVEARRERGGLAFLANYAAALRWDDRARAVCEEMIQNPATRAEGQFGLRVLANRAGAVSEPPATLTGE